MKLEEILSNYGGKVPNISWDYDTDAIDGIRNNEKIARAAIDDSIEALQNNDLDRFYECQDYFYEVCNNLSGHPWGQSTKTELEKYRDDGITKIGIERFEKKQQEYNELPDTISDEELKEKIAELNQMASIFNTKGCEEAYTNAWNNLGEIVSRRLQQLGNQYDSAIQHIEYPENEKKSEELQYQIEEMEKEMFPQDRWFHDRRITEQGIDMPEIMSMIKACEPYKIVRKQVLRDGTTKDVTLVGENFADKERYLRSGMLEGEIQRKTQYLEAKLKILKQHRDIDGNESRINELESQLEQMQDRFETLKTGRPNEIGQHHRARIEEEKRIQWQIRIEKERKLEAEKAAQIEQIYQKYQAELEEIAQEHGRIIENKDKESAKFQKIADNYVNTCAGFPDNQSVSSEEIKKWMDIIVDEIARKSNEVERVEKIQSDISDQIDSVKKLLEKREKTLTWEEKKDIAYANGYGISSLDEKALLRIIDKKIFELRGKVKKQPRFIVTEEEYQKEEELEDFKKEIQHREEQREAEEQRKQEEEAQRKAEEQRKQEEEAQREAEEQRKQEEEAQGEAEEQRKQEEEAQRKAEEQRKQEEEAQRKAEEQRKQEEEAQRKINEQIRQEMQKSSKTYEQPEEEKSKPREEDIRDTVENEKLPQKSEEQRISVNLWMNRFNNWYNSLNRLSQKAKTKVIQMKKDIVDAIREKMQKTKENEKSQDAQDEER